MQPPTIEFEPGSFRDPSGRVFLHGDSAYRALGPDGLASFETALEAGLYPRLVERGLTAAVQLGSPQEFDLADAPSPWLLRQDRIVPVTYAYEWSFSMLRDAALVTLELLRECLEAGFVLKDASSFNILFRGSRPVHVDSVSIQPLGNAVSWVGYAQFCRSFLFPLLLQTHRSIDFQPMLRAYLGEIPLPFTAHVLGRRAALRKGVLVHVLMQDRFQATFRRSAQDVAREAATAQGPRARQATLTLAKGLVALVQALEPPRQRAADATWTEYDRACSYTSETRNAKLAFVDRVLESRRPARVLDLGCNTGEYSRLALKWAGHVVSLDGDAHSIDMLYTSLKGEPRLSCIVADLSNPSPAQGWNQSERRGLLPRLRSDFVLALAVIHHLRITAGIPLAEIIDSLLALAPTGIVEWVDRADPMVVEMLALREDVFSDYSWEAFTTALARKARIVETVALASGTRMLCHWETSPASTRPSAQG